ncbi:hypothetical protein PFISCL1PPCAC_21722 [Pristionchus fissidentatus]|uniref:Uncharacterized protein n=1 Tax=Pristionchus fissidentatus TaxID=1538716 RepID=A0AAV5WFH8_9BILA|nr:hypothetical protein PFISCL1PPCAC_21722 [Pristionchus fissidentatus]
MKVLLLILLGLAAGASATWIGDEYWTTIDAGGQPFHGSVNDFARIDGLANKFIAFWITRSYYPGEHFEAFGVGYLNADGRVCATFAGFRRENIEICGQFRVLSIPARYAGKHLFDWVDGHSSVQETVGYLAHRIAKITNDDGEIVYGDAIPTRRTFAGALSSRSDAEIIETDSDFLQRVQLLRLNVPEETSRRPTIPRLPPPPPPVQMQMRELICDQFGNAFEKHLDGVGRTMYVPYDERANGGRRPNCPFYAPVIQHPVQPPPRDNKYAHAILPDHHDANGKTIEDSAIGYARRYRRKVLRPMRRSDE